MSEMDVVDSETDYSNDLCKLSVKFIYVFLLSKDNLKNNSSRDFIIFLYYSIVRSRFSTPRKC